MVIIAATTYFISNNESKELSDLETELEIKENLLSRMETDIEKIIANARPQCKGGTVKVTVDDTPIIELKEEIEELKQKIASLD